MICLLQKMWRKYRQLIVYCLIGCTGATLDFLIYLALTALAGFHYQLANFLSVSFGIVNNFFLNFYFNFTTRDRMLLRLLSFYLVGMFGCALSAGCLLVLVEMLEMSSACAKLGTIVVVTAMQFCLNKAITFRKESHDRS